MTLIKKAAYIVVSSLMLLCVPPHLQALPARDYATEGFKFWDKQHHNISAGKKVASTTACYGTMTLLVLGGYLAYCKKYDIEMSLNNPDFKKALMLILGIGGAATLATGVVGYFAATPKQSEQPTKFFYRHVDDQTPVRTRTHAHNNIDIDTHAI